MFFKLVVLLMLALSQKITPARCPVGGACAKRPAPSARHLGGETDEGGGSPD